MVNGDEEIQWGYLLDPTFQLVNTKGAPLTNGWIECYIHGTRTPYYCASDFDGTLHPFKIPLDSLGSNIVLANLELAYDVYVYNKFGTLIMSRYNVTPGRGGGGISGAVKTEIISESIDVTKTYDPETNTNIFDIELKTIGESQHWIGQNGSSIVIDPEEEDQNERTLPFPKAQNRDYIGSFVNRIEYGKFMYLEPGLYLVNCVIDFHQDIANLENEISQVLVYTGAGNANEDVAFERDDTGPDTSNNRHCLKMTFIRKVLGEDETSHIDCSNLLYFAPKTEVLWNQCSIKKLSIVKLDQGDGFTRVLHDDTMEGDGTEDNPLTVSGTVNHIYEVITSATSGKLDSSAYVAPVQSDWNQNDPDALDFILNKPNLGSYATHQEVVEATSGKLDTSAYTAPVQSDWTQNDSDALDYIKNKPEASELIPGSGIDITASGNNYVISSTASGDVTKQYVDQHLAEKLDTSAYTAPVQSDWNENDQSDLSFIKNKPTECSLIAGQNVWLEDMTSGVRINCSASGGGGSGVTEEYVQQAVASGTSGKLDIEDYTAPVQSDWNQSNSSMLDYIKNKPESSQLLEGQGINITASGNDFVISSTASGDVSKQYVDEHLAQKLDTSAYTAPVQSDWSQPDAAALSFIKNKPTECSLIAGKNVWIEDTTSGVRINCSASGGGGGGGGSYTAGEFIDITNDVISVNSGDVSNLIPGSGILITQSSAGTTVSIDPEELPKSTPYETVLWKGENGELISANNYSVNLSDDPLSYSRIGVYGRASDNNTAAMYVEFDPSYSAICKTVTPYYNGTTQNCCYNSYSFSGTNKMTVVSQTHIYGTTSVAGGLWIYKVVGINRKES